MRQITSLEQRKWWKAIVSVEHAVLITMSVLTALIVTVGVIMRYVLHLNFVGQEEILTVVAMWLYWVGGINGSLTNTHIGADLTDTFIKSWRSRKLINIFVQIISIGVISVFVYWGYGYIAWSMKLGGLSTGLKIPLIVSKITLFIGFVFMGLCSVYHLIRVIQTRESDYQKED